MAVHHNSAHLPSGDAAADGDPFLDEVVTKVTVTEVDQAQLVDSDAGRIRTDIHERLHGVLPGEAALVYHRLSARLPALFDDTGG